MERKIQCSITSYVGNEKEVQLTLSRNRSISHNRSYLDWRYQGDNSSCLEPIVFWLRKKDGTSVGMASLIARPYWVDNQLTNIYVLGDISINHDLRGKGLGCKLINFMNNYLRNELKQPAFVIPNLPVQRILQKSGWNDTRPFFWYLWILDPLAKFIPQTAGSRFCLTFKGMYRFLMLRWLDRFLNSNLMLNEVTYIDDSFDVLWSRVSKEGVVFRDRRADFFRWRFEKHPSTRFKFRKLTDGINNLGCIVFDLSQDGLCRIVDLLVYKIDLLAPMMALFFKELSMNPKVYFVRIKLSSDHTYGSMLKSIGCIRRQEEDVYQFYFPPSQCAESNKWLVSVADKDT